MELEAVIQGDMAEGTVMMEQRSLSQKSSLLLTTSVVNIQEDTMNLLVPIQLLNLSPDSVTVCKGTRVNHSVVVAVVEGNSPTQCDESNVKWQAVESAGREAHPARQNKNSCMLYC